MATSAVPDATARRIGVPQGMDRALVRIRSRQGAVVGSGFLVTARHVVTCTHVVLRALHRADRDTVSPGDAVRVDFPLVAPDVLVTAEMAVSRALEADGGDVTVLSLTGDLPPGLEPVRLVVASDVWGHPFRAFGFPQRLDQGVWAAGVLRAPQGDGWVQMEAGAAGYPVEAGFSGGAVWDDELAAVVGMTVAADTRPDLRAAFLIPASTLMRVWPELAALTLPPCPYRGLNAFRSSDAAQFFGREDLTERLAREALRRPLLAVVGPSGSGKSSVVFAGVVPRLGRERDWLSVSMRPAQGSSPLFALAAALVTVLEPDRGETERLSAANELVAVLRDGRLTDVVDRIVARAQLDHLLLVVDQMEELFAREQDEVHAFVRALLSAVHPREGSPSRALTVVLTLRADFLGNALQNPSLAGALEDSVITIGQMRREQLRAVIEGPLPPEVRYEAGLVDRIVGDVGDEPGGLPLLEFALTLLWERQEGGLLTHRAYQELGGVDGALASYAEHVYSDQLLPADHEEVRRLFIQLVRPAEVGSSVRRVARRSELGERRWQLGQRLAATRLLVADRDVTGAESVELVHEALIDGWKRLQHWTKTDRAFRAWQEQLRAAVTTWEDVRRDAGGLLRGAPLAEAERWLQERPDDLGDTERRFIAASRARRGRSVRRLWLAVAGLTVLLVLATTLGVFATVQSTRLSTQATLAGARSLAGQAVQLADHQPDVALLLAAVAYRTARTPETVGVVTRLATGERQVEKLVGTRAGPVLGVQFDAVDPNRLVLYGPEAITIWDVARNTTVKRWSSTGPIGRTTASRDGRVIAVHRRDGNLVLWFPADDRTVPVPDANLPADPSLVEMAFSPDGTELAVCDPERIRTWEPGTRRLRATVDNDQGWCNIGFTATNELATVYPSGIVVRNLDTGQVTARADFSPPPDSDSGPDFAVAPDGRTAIATTYLDDISTTTVWDLDDLRPLGIVGYSGDVVFTQDGQHALVGYDTAVVLVDLTSRRGVETYSRHDGSTSATSDVPFYGGSLFSLSADGRRIVVPAGGDTVAILDTAGGSGLPAVAGVSEAAAPSAGDLVVLGITSSREVAVHRSSGDPPVVVVPAPPDGTYPETQPTLSPDGRHVAFSGAEPDEIVVAGTAGPGSPVTRLPIGGTVEAMAFDPASGRFLATADASTVTVRSVPDGAVRARIAVKDGMRPAGVAVDPDGRRVATYDEAGNASLSDTASGETRALPMQAVRALSFSPDGRWMGVSTDTEVRLWDVGNGRESPVRLPGGTNGSPVVFSHDGRYLAASRFLDGINRTTVWQVDDGALVGEVTGLAADVAFFPDGHRLLVAGYEGVTLTTFDAGSALDTICRIVGRNLTSDEWDRYARELKRTSACP